MCFNSTFLFQLFSYLLKFQHRYVVFPPETPREQIAAVQVRDARRSQSLDIFQYRGQENATKLAQLRVRIHIALLLCFCPCQPLLTARYSINPCILNYFSESTAAAAANVGKRVASIHFSPSCLQQCNDNSIRILRIYWAEVLPTFTRHHGAGQAFAQNKS